MPLHKTKTEHTRSVSQDFSASEVLKPAKKYNRLFARLRLGDVEDPVLYAAEPLCKWEATPEGQWAKKHADDLTWNLHPDDFGWGYEIRITGLINDKDYVVYLLKFKDSGIV